MSLATLFDFLKPAHHLPEITDRQQVDEDYKYWRMRIFYSIYVGYLFYYFTRKSFTFIIPFLNEDLGFTKSEIGAMISMLGLTYGVSKFLSGILSDRCNPRYFMAIGLILTGVCNICFGFFSTFIMLTIFWGFNGWFQGWGWPACTKQLTHWFSRKERGTWWSAATTSHTAGSFLVAYLVGYTALWFGWRWAMYITGFICIMVGLWLINRLRDVPQSLGLPSVERYRAEEGEVLSPSEETEAPLSVKQILFDHIFKNKYLWVLAAAYFFVYIIRNAVDSWGVSYLVETKECSKTLAAVCVSLFEVGGFIGVLVAGFCSDRFYAGRRVPVMIWASLGLIFAVIGLWYLVPNQLLVSSLLMALIGFLVFGPQMLIGLAAAEFVNKKAASTANGFVGCFAYLGVVVSGYPLGKITELYGWYWFVIALAVCAMMSLLVLLPIWSKRGQEPESSTPVTVDSDIEPEAA